MSLSKNKVSLFIIIYLKQYFLFPINSLGNTTKHGVVEHCKRISEEDYKGAFPRDYM